MKKTFFIVKKMYVGFFILSLIASCSKSNNSKNSNDQNVQNHQELLQPNQSKDLLGSWDFRGILDTKKSPLNEGNIGSYTFYPKTMDVSFTLYFSPDFSRLSTLFASVNSSSVLEKINANIVKIDQHNAKIKYYPLTKNAESNTDARLKNEVYFLTRSLSGSRNHLLKGNKLYIKKNMNQEEQGVIILNMSLFETPYYVFEKTN